MTTCYSVLAGTISVVPVVLASMLTAIMPASQDAPLATYGKYEFVTSDSVIFVDDLATETLGEFPSRWKLISGMVEIAKLGDSPVIAFKSGVNVITPSLRNSLVAAPAFTIEFDVYFHLDGSNEAYMVNFGAAGEMDVRTNRVRLGAFEGAPSGGPVKAGWHRLAIAITGRAMKVYLDQDRVLNVPELRAAPTLFQLKVLGHSTARGHPASVRDIRLAIGAVDPYDQLLKSGFFVSRGVNFEVNKATLRPISLGALNQVAAMLRAHPEVKLIVEGHTDADGEAAANQILSEQRAATVVQHLNTLGIGAERLSAKGFGETRPVAGNASAEDKANNRRVAFRLNK